MKSGKKIYHFYFQNWSIWCLFIFFFMKLGATPVFHTTWSCTGVLACCATAFLVGQWNPTPQVIGLVTWWLCKLHTACLMLYTRHGALNRFCCCFLCRCSTVPHFGAEHATNSYEKVRIQVLLYSAILPSHVGLQKDVPMFTFQSCQYK